MKTRIFQNWRTSLLGFVLLILSSVLLFMKIITFGEFTAFLPTVIGLIYVQDTIFKIHPTK